MSFAWARFYVPSSLFTSTLTEVCDCDACPYICTRHYLKRFAQPEEEERRPGESRHQAHEYVRRHSSIQRHVRRGHAGRMCGGAGRVVCGFIVRARVVSLVLTAFDFGCPTCWRVCWRVFVCPRFVDLAMALDSTQRVLFAQTRRDCCRVCYSGLC